MVDIGHVWAVMQQAARSGGMLAIHAEDDDIVMYMYDKLEREGLTSFEHLPLVHNALSEDLAFRRIIRLASHVDHAALYLMHLTAATGVEAVREARAQGLPIYAEALHNYAVFTEDDYRRPDGVVFHTYPALKTPADRDALWDGLADGTISTIATDESCISKAVKTYGRTIFDAAGGQVGVETRLGVAWTEGVVKRGLSLERFAAVTSTNAAHILGLYPSKGVIAPGSDADLVVFDPADRRVLRAADLHGTDYSIWEGYEAAGWPRSTFLRGELVVDRGQFLPDAACSRRVIRRISSAILSGPGA